MTDRPDVKTPSESVFSEIQHALGRLHEAGSEIEFNGIVAGIEDLLRLLPQSTDDSLASRVRSEIATTKGRLFKPETPYARAYKLIERMFVEKDRTKLFELFSQARLALAQMPPAEDYLKVGLEMRISILECFAEFDQMLETDGLTRLRTDVEIIGALVCYKGHFDRKKDDHDRRVIIAKMAYLIDRMNHGQPRDYWGREVRFMEKSMKQPEAVAGD